MGSKQELIHKLHPFTSLTEDMSMYDHVTYVRDIDLCTPKMITLVTGNILKYFRFTVGEPYPLKGIDNLAKNKIEEYKKKESLRLAKIEESKFKKYPQDTDLLEGETSANSMEDNKEGKKLQLDWVEEDGSF